MSDLMLHRPEGILSNVSADDIPIEYITITQKQSENFGFDHPDGEVCLGGVTIAPVGGQIQFIPIWCDKIWIVKNAENSKKIMRIALAKSSTEYQFSGVENGVTVKYFYTYVMTGHVCDAKGNKITKFPVRIQFSSSSFKAGKAIVARSIKLGEKGFSSWKEAIVLAPKDKSDGHSKWWVWDVVGARESRQEEMDAAKEWFDRIDSLGPVVYNQEHSVDVF